MTNDRMASSLARPPALRITCASPLLNPAYLAGSSRASMQVRIAKPRAGGSASSLFAPKVAAYSSLAPTDLSEDGHRSCYPGAGFPFPRRNHLRIFAITELAILRLYAAQQGFTKSFAIPPELRSTSSSSGLELSTRRSATVGGSPPRRRAGPDRGSATRRPEGGRAA